MRITHYFKSTSKNAHYMRYDIEHTKGSIFDAYNKPSQSKINAYNLLHTDYMHNECTVLGIPCKEINVPKSMNKLGNKAYMRYINGTFNVAGASSHFFSTVAIFEDVETNIRYIIKETHSNTYMCALMED